jgi:L-threonylcarbamoyladenylate synthase
MVKTQICASEVEKAAKAVREGRLVVYPTETVYGLGADPFSKESIMRVFEAKGRSKAMPLSVAVGSVEDIGKVGVVNSAAKALARKFMPGPITIIVEKKDGLPYELTSGLGTIGIRVPDNRIALELVRLAGPITATSANISGKEPPKSFEEAKAQMEGRVDMILDGGKCKVGKESTIVDVSVEGMYTMVREGAISKDMIEKALRNA